MADPVTIAAITAAAASATSSLMATGQARQVGAAQAKLLETQAGVARQQAGLETEALSRETRRQFGELRAAGAQAGLVDSVTFGDVYKQAATAAELDALSLAYQGETEAQSLLSEARITRASRRSWVQGILQATGAGLGTYAAAGGQFPSGRASTKFTPKVSGPTAMTKRYTPMSPTGPRNA
jgi:hypothetical protein